MSLVSNSSFALFGYITPVETGSEELVCKEWNELNIIWISSINFIDNHKNFLFYTAQSSKMKKKKSTIRTRTVLLINVIRNHI